MKESSFKLPEISRKEYLRWLLRKRRRFKVTGLSMFPVLKPGDEVLIDPKAYYISQPEVGDIVVACHPARIDYKIIKRIASLLPDGALNLQGENPFESTDFNRVPASKIIGKVTSMFFSEEEKQKANST